MDDGRLRAVLMAVDRGSFSKAAAELGYTQSAMTHLVNNLEAELGCTLFSRTNRGLILTPEGEASILGWANASRGCPEADAACTALRLRLQGTDPEQYLRLFGQESGHSREEINAWLPLVAAALTVGSTEAQREILKPYMNY